MATLREIAPHLVDGDRLFGRRVRVFAGNQTTVDSTFQTTETKTVNGKTTSQVKTSTTLSTKGLVVENLRVQFKVKKTLKKEPNTCEVQISNLNESSRAQLSKGRVKIRLDAGYDDNISRLLVGDSRFVDQIKDGADWVTKIQCGDGEQAFQYRRVAKSFGPGVKASDVIIDVAKKMGLTVTGLDHARGVVDQFTQGHTAYGKVSSELDKLASGRGLEWSIQDEQVQILALGGVTSETEIVLSASTGLVGSPEHGNPEKNVPVSPDEYTAVAQKQKGPAILKVKSLLQPGLRPGRRVRVISEAYKNGASFRIQTVTHTGDTHGGEWYSECELVPASSAGHAAKPKGKK